jgi:serine protease
MSRSYPEPAVRGCRALAWLALLCGLLAFQAAPASASSRSFARDEVLVHYRGDPGQEAVDVAPGQSVHATLSDLRGDPSVAYARPDYLVHAAAFTPNDPGSKDLRGNWSRDQWNFLSPRPDRVGIDVVPSWQRLISSGRPGAKGITVAVLDTGVAYRRKGRRYRRDHDLPGRKGVVHPRDFVGADDVPLDPNGHGTHVASIIRQSTDNGLGLTGIAYRAKLMPIRVLNRHENGKGSKVARGIRFATAHGADVINLSLDFEPDVQHCDQIVAVCHAIQHAIHEKVAVVAAAGNENQSHVLYPAAANGVIGVGASTYRGCAADYSNYGAGLDLVAPGGGEDKGPQVTGDAGCQPGAPGFEIRQYSLLPRAAARGNYRRFGIVGMQGTSMAAAHVSGVAALVLASRVCGRHPTPPRITHRLEQTAIDRGLPGSDDVYGAGLLDAAQATSRDRVCSAG